jgi:hypothetical protein
VRHHADDTMSERRQHTRTCPWRAFLAGLLLAGAPAWAARTNHLFLDETQTLPEGDVELENWFWVQGQVPNIPGLYVSDWVSLGPTVGISSHLELSLPLVIVATSAQTVLNSISLVARYRFLAREQDEGFQPLIRVEYQQPLANYDAYTPAYVQACSAKAYYQYTCSSTYPFPPELKVLFAVTYGSLKSVRATLNVGVQLGLPFLQTSSQNSASFSALGTAGLGISVPLGSEFRVAAELDGQIPLSGVPAAPNTAQLFVGPSVAWTRGQIWVTFGSLFGLTNNSNRFVPKVLWGITF